MRQRFNFKASSELFNFLFQFYNLPSMIRRYHALHNGSREHVKKLKERVTTQYKESFTSRRGGNKSRNESGGRSNKQARSNHGEGGQGQGRQQTVFNEKEVVSALADAGYTLDRQEKNDSGWTLMDEVIAMAFLLHLYFMLICICSCDPPCDTQQIRRAWLLW